MKKYSQKNKKLKNINFTKPGLTSLSILSLSACGGGGGGGGATNSAPPPPPVPQAVFTGFTETSTNVFVSNTNSGGDFDFQDATDALTITGGAGRDDINTGGGDDVINGGAGNDKILAMRGADILDGGAGYDILDYGSVIHLSSSEGVNVNLSTNTVSGGDAEGDQISNFEAVRGSDHVDVIIGDAGNNEIFGGGAGDTIFGGAGNDIIAGEFGADTLDGGTGLDHLVYGSYTSPNDGNGYGFSWSSEEGVNVNLATGVGSGGPAQGDVISNFENLTGSDYNDTLTGDANDNIIFGGSGDDVVFGGIGDDTLYGDTSNIFSFDGNDTINGEAGDDTINGGGGDDILNGGSGNDHIQGHDGNDVINGGSETDIIFPGIGTDTIDAGSGDDRIFLSAHEDSLYLDNIDGGIGDDTIFLDPGNLNGAITYDFSRHQASNIEGISLNDFDEQHLINVNIQDVLNITDVNNQLHITGGPGDTVTAAGQGWLQGADQVVGTITYNTYTAGGATLLIEEDISQTIS